MSENELVQWFLVPLSGAATHFVPPAVSWHGRLMVLSWGILVPLGILVARYFKVTPNQDWPRVLDNKLWWHWHRATQYSSVFLSFVALGLIYGSAHDRTPLAQTHGWLGLTVMLLGCAQVVSAWLRGSKGGPTDQSGNWRGDHFDMSKRRRLFEKYHKFLGLLAVALAIFALFSGLIVADAPRWMFAILVLWWSFLVALASFFQRRGMCLDTYQAIWGPDPHNPGSLVKPIGFGIRRR